MLIWNVYIFNINHQKMEVYNVFEHGSFLKDVKKSVKKKKEIFKEELLRDLRYYFWSKSEWEIILKPWCGGRNDVSEKIDVFEQVYNNFDLFAEYIWKNKKLLLEDKE